MKTSMNELLNGLPQRQSKLELPVVNESISIWYSDWVQTIMSSKLDWQYPDWFRHSPANEVLGIYSISFSPRREQRLPIISEPQSQVFARSYTFENRTDRSQTSRTGGFMFVTHRLHRRIQAIMFEMFQHLSMLPIRRLVPSMDLRPLLPATGGV
jgi:hypothetical protein